MKIARVFRCMPALVLVPVACSLIARAGLHTLDDPGSPVQVSFDDATGRMAVSVKATGTTWNQGAAGGQSWRLNGIVVRSDALNLSVPALINSVPVTVGLQLQPSEGDLRVTLDGSTAGVAASGLVYPYPFFTATGDGYAICPVNSGYVIPTSDLSIPGKFAPVANRHMEFVGGTDATNTEAWIGIIETPSDKTLSLSAFTVGGVQRVGLGPQWQGSNANAAHTPGLLSYPRVVRYRFFTGGGYVAVAKRFRHYAQTRGWLQTLAEKIVVNPAVADVIGAPIIYLWGDGHDTAFLDELHAAGITEALLQLSVNHADEYNAFPNLEHANGRGWFDAVRAHGYRGGFYDIYQAARPMGGGGYSGFTHLWPADALNGNWAYVNSAGQPVQSNGAYDICAARQAFFAGTIRLPAHLGRFDMDAVLFDTVCAQPPTECYSTAHFETRGDDIANRAALLAAASANPTKLLLAGTEQARSWAVPELVWAEGVQHLGAIDSQGAVGTGALGGFNGNAYPDITTDVKTLTTAQFSSLLSDGYQAPLWDLVYHDCLLSTLHWERAQNKFVHVWDRADLAALLRGQTALLNLTWRGAPGAVSDSPPAIVTDVDGNRWSMRWTDPADGANFVPNRVLQTYHTVCAWHREVGLMELTDHRWLTDDRTVQMSEFSLDGGVSGLGIVVNFGRYDGDHGVVGDTWTGSPRAGVTVAVPVNGYQTYAWGNGRVSAPAFDPAAGTFAGARKVTIASATPGATIRYTTDGSTPSRTNGMLYAEPVSLTTTTIIKAVAYDEAGRNDSAIGYATYTLASTSVPPPSTPPPVTPPPSTPPPSTGGGGGGGAVSAWFIIALGLSGLLRWYFRDE